MRAVISGGDSGGSKGVPSGSLRGCKATGPYRVLDLAAGSGVWSIALAEKSPHVRVTVVDWPAVIPVCRTVVLRRETRRAW